MGSLACAVPGPRLAFITKDEMADYLEAYAARFELPVRMGVRVDRVSRQGDRFVVAAGDRRFEAEQVVVAMANYQQPRVPAFAGELDPRIVQLHSIEYRGPSQLREGPVLIVGAGNSGAEIGAEVVRSHPTWMSGRDVGELPFRIHNATGGITRAGLVLAPIVFRVLFHRVLTVSTPIGRRARPKFLAGGGPLIRVRRKELAAAGAEFVARVAGVRDGQPLLEDGRTLEVENVIWCTGFHPGFSWIDLPILEGDEPMHERGVVASEPGLYFVGLEFLYAASSTMIHGVGRDAERIVKAIAARVRALSVAGNGVASAEGAQVLEGRMDVVGG